MGHLLGSLIEDPSDISTRAPSEVSTDEWTSMLQQLPMDEHGMQQIDRTCSQASAARAEEVRKEESPPEIREWKDAIAAGMTSRGPKANLFNRDPAGAKSEAYKSCKTNAER